MSSKMQQSGPPVIAEAAEGRGEIVRLIVGVASIGMWVAMGLISSFMLQTSTVERLGTVVAVAFAVFIIIWAWAKARTANDFLTVTTTTRVLVGAFLVLALYKIGETWSESGTTVLPADADEYVLRVFTNLLGPIGIVLLLVTDFLRIFTIQKKLR